MNKRIPSFTLIELTLALLLMTIIVAICYLSYELILKQTSAWKETVEYQTESMRFISRIKEDLLRSGTCHYLSDNEVSMLAMDDEIEYHIHPEFQLRIQQHEQDTFWVSIDMVNAYWKNQLHATSGLTDRIQFLYKAAKADSLTTFSLVKWYDAQTKWNHEH